MEGTWEEILEHSSQLAGKRVRVVILPREQTKATRGARPVAVDEETERFLDEFAGAWAGNDLDACLEQVYKTRTETEWWSPDQDARIS